MNRAGVIDILRKIQSTPPGLRQYKLIEQLRLMWSPRSGLRDRSIWARLKAGKRRAEQAPDASVHMTCCSCGYDLDGLGSPFGPTIPVGPALCPECGIEFPAIW
ncbi:MAG: hypothetical protein JJ916_08155 [Phycisphaerales bacterium]|nr:hypothetical protein [Phycisphaerales bacterium]